MHILEPFIITMKRRTTTRDLLSVDSIFHAASPVQSIPFISIQLFRSDLNFIYIAHIAIVIAPERGGRGRGVNGQELAQIAMYCCCCTILRMSHPHSHCQEGNCSSRRRRRQSIPTIDEGQRAIAIATPKAKDEKNPLL